MNYYELYGLKIAVDLPLFGMRTNPKIDPQFTIRRANPEKFQGLSCRKEGAKKWFFHQQQSDQSRYLHWFDSCEFLINPEVTQAIYLPGPEFLVESFQAYSLTQIFSFVAVHQGIEPLHATAVEYNGSVALLMGDCGQGKSTLATALVARGFKLMADDLLVIKPGQTSRPSSTRKPLLAYPGNQHIKLFSSTARKLLPGGDSGKLMLPRSNKLVIRFSKEQICLFPAPVKAVFVLADPSPKQKQVRMKELTQAQAMLSLLENTFNTVVMTPDRWRNQFSFNSKLAASVPFWKLSYPRKFESLPEVCESIRTFF